MNLRRGHGKWQVNWNIPEFSKPENTVQETGSGAAAGCNSSFVLEQCTCSSDKLCIHFIDQAKKLAHVHSFIDISAVDNNTLIFETLMPGDGSVVKKLMIKNDYTWEFKYKDVVCHCDFSTKLGIADLDNLFTLLKTSAFCKGNEDFPELMFEYGSVGQQKLLSHDRQTVVGYVHDFCIRSSKCPILLPSGQKLDRCDFCSKLRDNLRARKSQLKNRQSNEATCRTDVNSKCGFVNLKGDEKDTRLRSMSKELSKRAQKIKAQERIINLKLEKESLNVASEQHTFLEHVCKTNTADVVKQWGPDSPQRLFWEQQMKRLGCKDPRGMRWHPTIIRWCISLYMKGPSSYEQLTRSGFVALPSISTIKSYLQFTDPNPGVNADVLQILVEEFKLVSAHEHDKNVALVWDEVKIKSGLVVSRGSGKLVGFTCLDNFSYSQLEALSNLDKATHEPQLASHLLVFMVRSLTTRVNLPFMWYPCTGYNSSQLWGSVWNATSSLEELGLKVRAWVCDGATSNRRFFKLHKCGLDYEGIQFCTRNRYAMDRNIYFLCDVEHLLKTTRNNLENSHANMKTRTLMKNSKPISWAHIKSTFEQDMDQSLCKLIRIRHEHIHLSPQLRMRVKLAAQVLSSSMANAITARQIPDITETANLFIQQFV